MYNSDELLEEERESEALELTVEAAQMANAQGVDVNDKFIADVYNSITTASTISDA